MNRDKKSKEPWLVLKKILILSFGVLAMVGLLSVGGSSADEISPPINTQKAASTKDHWVTKDKFGCYSSAMSSDKKTIIANAEGKIVAEEIYSPNRRFYALADFNKKTTTIYETILVPNVQVVSLKFGKVEKSWSMDGCEEMLGLSNDGEYLVVGSRGEGTFLYGYSEDHVMLSFFKRGKLLSQVKLNQLITDFSKLQKTEFGYTWGKYLGLNAAGYYVVETIEGKKVLFDIKTGTQAEFKSKRRESLSVWKNHQDIIRCYEFYYPENYLLTEDMVLKCNNALASIYIDADTTDLAYHPPEERDPTKISLEEFSYNQIKLMFDADGPNGSTYASGVVKKRRFLNKNGLDTLELYVKEVSDHLLTVEGNQNVITKRVRGPFYAVLISQPNESYRVLFFKLCEEGERSRPNRDILKKIVNTVRILK